MKLTHRALVIPLSLVTLVLPLAEPAAAGPAAAGPAAAGPAAAAVPAPAGTARRAAGEPPSSMASLGDSIARGFNACGWFSDCTSRSFASGTVASVNSHYLRIRAVNPAINSQSYNVARSGARIADLPGQASAAVSRGAEYVTILMGGNDACTASEASMTSVAAFRASLDDALARLKAGLPGTRAYLISIPDVKRLWEVGRGNSSARGAWSVFRICQAMLANPTSTSAADEARRDRVRQRVIDFNTQFAAACEAYGPNCRFDGNRIFNYDFQLSQISTWDYFHPNTSGQTVLASVSYAAGWGW
jgi:lysophospholipase L1-like esterase